MKYCVALALVLSSCGRGDLNAPNPGAVGPTGAQGISALPCTVKPISGGAEVSCPDGSHQDVLNGVTGSTGLQGIAGGHVSTVKLCPGVSVYPVSFIEEAVCIENKLYGVYWNGSAWLTELPPGHYSSTSTTSPCSFTVSLGCVVSK